MGKKMKLPFSFKSTETSRSLWPWPACSNPKTLSFRVNHNIFKTMNSAYVDPSIELVDTPDYSCFSNNYESPSFSTVIEEESIETVIRGLRSERLLFEPGETSAAILEEAKDDDSPFKECLVMAKDDDSPFKESLVMAVDSRDPFADFRRSMEEMVEAHGLKDWECLEELLTCYLKVNSKNNHGYIVGAFVDLLVGLAFTDSSSPFSSSSTDDRCSSSTTHSFTSPLSFSSSTSSTSPCLSSLEVDDDIEKTIENSASSSNALS